MNRKAKLWELYLQHYESIRDEAQEDFHTLFGRAFLAAYEQQLERLRREKPAAPKRAPCSTSPSASRSEVGQRKSNEDKVRVCRDGSRWVAVLADGAGGHRGGAEASRRAVAALEAALCKEDAEFSAAALTRRRGRGARRRPGGAGRRARRSPACTRPSSCCGSTLERQTRALVARRRLAPVPRAARRRHGVDLGRQRRAAHGRRRPASRAAQAESHPQKNQLIAALGIEEGVEPHTVRRRAVWLEGDAFLLCSDGWWGALDEATIAAASPTPTGRTNG